MKKNNIRISKFLWFWFPQ